MKKIVFYTSNSMSLGHLKRSCQIADAIRTKDEKVKIGLITSAANPIVFGNFFDYHEQIVPLTDKLLEDPYQEARLENADVALSFFKRFKPDLVIADFLLESNFTFYPLKYALDNFSTKSVLIWRLGEIKNLSYDLDREKSKLDYFKKIILPYNKIELKDLLSARIFRKIISDSKFKISGPVFRKIDKKRLAVCKRKYGVSSKNFLITIALGGGGQLKVGKCESPQKIVDNFLKIYPKLEQIISNLKVIIVYGPCYDKRVVETKGIEIVKFEKNLLELFHLSQLVISPAGYNICYEIIEARTPALLVPLWRKNREQFERAQYLKKKGIVDVWQSNSLTGFLKTVISCYDNLGEMKADFKKFVKNKSGNRNIAQIILNLC